MHEGGTGGKVPKPYCKVDRKSRGHQKGAERRGGDQGSGQALHFADGHFAGVHGEGKGVSEGIIYLNCADRWRKDDGVDGVCA